MSKEPLLALALFSCIGLARTPRFIGPFPVCDAGVPIDVGECGSPFVFDWNRDGTEDLICGQFDSGKIRFYPNQGPDTAPEFCGYSYLQADSAEIILPFV
jgi:hypothetical protein